MEQIAQGGMTPDERMKFVEQELLQVLRGDRSMMACPYCHKLNVKPKDADNPEPLCCNLFAMAAISAMAGREMQEAMDRMAQITDKVYG